MIAFDTNILIYAELPHSDDLRHRSATALLARASETTAIMPLQVLGEFLHVCRRKTVAEPSVIRQKVETYLAVFEAPATSAKDMLAAQTLITSHRLQFFDALIITVAARAGATVLLSEDMQDGLELEGLKVINPFRAESQILLAAFVGTDP